MNDKKLMNLAADNIRILAASMVEKAKSGHPGGAMGGADFINVLFSEFLIFDPENPSWEGRDRFFLDPGHMSPMLYSALALQGKFTIDELQQFRQWGSPTPGHPERDILRGIENTSGPLGQGHAYGAGAAIAQKFLETKLSHTMMQHTIYIYIRWRHPRGDIARCWTIGRRTRTRQHRDVLRLERHPTINRMRCGDLREHCCQVRIVGVEGDNHRRKRR